MSIVFSNHAPEQILGGLTMKMRYDAKVDAVYIELAKGAYSKTRKISDAVLVDEDKKGKVLGIEILDATKNISAFDPRKLHRISA